ncbi:hydrogenase maturation nickel metallochaperone HypA [Patescibacteria group bacterium]|nr:hydrogenase maturation nickel metallochaperone HypA [Patescibacteria group bacterium]
MHDFHLADQIVKIAKEHAAKNNLAKVSKIVLELGEIVEHGEGITPENLEYNIKLLMPVEKVKIKKVKGGSWKLVSIDGM